MCGRARVCESRLQCRSMSQVRHEAWAGAGAGSHRVGPPAAGFDPSQPAYFYAVKLFHKMGLLEHAATGSRLRPGRNPPQTCWRRQAVPDEILRPASCLCVARLGRTSRSTGGSWAGRRSPSPTGRRWSRRRCLRAGPPDPVAFTGRARTLSLDLAAVSIPLLFRPCCVAGQGR